MALKIYFRTDASLKIGSGHVMRCLTLAEGLRESGAEVEFVCREYPGNINELITSKNFVVNELALLPTNESQASYYRNKYASWLGVSEIEDAEQTINAFGEKEPDWLIVDHYSLGKYWESKIRTHVCKIMVIDDLADRPHDCDLLLNQNYFIGGEARYKNLVPPTCTKLLGPQYALLRPDFLAARRNLKPQTGNISRIFVFFGGVDSHNVTSMALESLSSSDFDELEVDVVIGKNNQHRTQIIDLVAKRPRTKLYVQIENMAELMVKADLALGAGGINTWERMCLNLESHVIITAENQTIVNEQLNKNNYIHLIGNVFNMNSTKIGIHLNKAISLKKNILNFKTNFSSLCDGSGVSRIIKEITSG